MESTSVILILSVDQFLATPEMCRKMSPFYEFQSPIILHPPSPPLYPALPSALSPIHSHPVRLTLLRNPQLYGPAVLEFSLDGPLGENWKWESGTTAALNNNDRDALFSAQTWIADWHLDEAPLCYILCLILSSIPLLRSLFLFVRVQSLPTSSAFCFRPFTLSPIFLVSQSPFVIFLPLIVIVSPLVFRLLGRFPTHIFLLSFPSISSSISCFSYFVFFLLLLYFSPLPFFILS